MESVPYCVLIDLARFLSIPEVASLALSCKDISEHISQGFKLILTCYLGLPINLNIPEAQLRSAYCELRQRRLLRFDALFTDGGVSEVEFLNFFGSMWRYNGLNYSTYYKPGPSSSLSPVNCVGYFAGGFQDECFYATYHHDEMNWRVNYSLMPERFNLPEEDIRVYRNIDPLYGRSIGFENTLSIPGDNDPTGEAEGDRLLRYKLIPHSEFAVVSEIALARPLFYTGTVRTLCVFISSKMTDYSTSFPIPFGLETFETALRVANTVKQSAEGQVSFIEYSPNPSADFYPVLWVQFNSFKVNNLAYKLHKPQLCSRVLVHLINIDDRRQEYNLTRMEPNFDLTYCVMLGSIISK
jgi:hypothetical protein